MQNFIKTIVNAIQHWTKGKIKESTIEINNRIDNKSLSEFNNDLYYNNHAVALTVNGSDFQFDNWENWAVIVDKPDIITDWTNVIWEITYNIDDELITEECLLTKRSESTYIADYYDGRPHIGIVEGQDPGNNLINGLYITYVANANDGRYVPPVTANLIVLDEKRISKDVIDKDLLEDVEAVIETANIAVANAATAQATADEKMNQVNPIGSGSFGMNRRSREVVKVGNYSASMGHDTCAQYAAETVIGRSNRTQDNQIEVVEKNIWFGFNDQWTRSVYVADAYEHVEGSGKWTLQNPSLMSLPSMPKEGGYYMSFALTAEDGSTTPDSSSMYYVHSVYANAWTLHVRIQADRYSWQESGGDYNGQYAFVVGNGSEDFTSNAHTLSWDGNAWFQGDVYVGSTSGTNKDDGSNRLLRTDEIATDEDTMDLMAELGYVTPVTSSDGSIYTSANGEIYSL